MNFALIGLLLLTGCNRQQVVNPAQANNSQTPAIKTGFDGNRAYELLKKQVDFGPRVPGTEAHTACRTWLREELTKYCDRVFEQPFIHVHTITRKKLQMYNIIGMINEQASKKVLLCAHWDSRPTADQELDLANRKKAIPGANDGASGVAVLLEVARVLKEQKPGVGVIIAFWDGEDYGPLNLKLSEKEWQERELENMLLGSKYFATHLPVPKPAYGVLLDMIGDKDLQIYREGNSEYYAPNIVDRIYKIARDLGYEKQFPNQTKYTITDDHLPLNEGGIPCVDLIDFDYAYWHTLKDTPDKCSPQSLQAVGDVVVTLIRGEKADGG